MEPNYIKMGITSFIALALTLVIATSTGIIELGIGSNVPFAKKEPDFLKKMQQNSLVNTLKESLPVYYKSLVEDPKLDKEQKQSLEYMYLPLINEFIKTGDILLIDKSNSIKHLIINGTLRAELKPKD